MAGTVVHACNPSIGEAETGGLWGSPASPARDTGRLQLCRRHFPQRRWTTFLRRTPQGCSLVSIHTPAPACTYICEHAVSHACIPHTLLTLDRKSPNTQPQARAVLSMERRHAGIRHENWSSASSCLSGKASHTASQLPHSLSWDRGPLLPSSSFGVEIPLQVSAPTAIFLPCLCFLWKV